ncbi:glycine zipper 2TM domain-containing protein [Cardiobacterium valvarum]|uniref:Surface antigen n=1 Tax=Cardiobacterium valvarum TaxID=194702 RepID=A0A381EE07_9GAMM|nr:glycine zipper 2TM domain-containing protein [Cardiobacterium valvarum]SUX25248.1 Surface antigen [Cardiobacterium valvarum]
MNNKYTFLAAILALALSGCGISHGDRLNYGNVNAIQRNVTTEAQIRAMFGEPVSVQINQKLGVKKLVYAYRNDDSIKKGAAGIGGAILGGVLGHQIGGGSGQAIATGVGAAAGGLLGDNAVTARQESQMLEVEISLATGRVSDYNYTEQKGRTQSWGISGGVAPL